MQEMQSRRLRPRVANACDICKLRKIKCSGTEPCSYCVRRAQPDDCHYTIQRRRRRLTSTEDTASPSHSHSSPPSVLSAASHHTPTRPISHPTPPVPSSQSQHGPPSHPASHDLTSHDHQLRSDPANASEEHEGAEVPKEARLLRDTQGKLIFIGDCAPLSFFQTVRRLVTSRVDVHAFAPGTSGYSVLENANSRHVFPGGQGTGPPPVDIDVDAAVSAYLEITSGLVDLFDNTKLRGDMSAWASGRTHQPGIDDMESAVNYLVLAIGCQKTNDAAAQRFFEHAQNVAFATLGGNLGVASIQAFILITLYMLCACQISGAFLFFGIGVRAAYSIGVHRTAVNARFGPESHRQRDRLWKSLRIVDLFLSTSMGRPPATSGTDCTVPYRELGPHGQDDFDLLNASVQVLLIIEAIVIEVYSRRKISPRLTEGISRELREWSTRWLQRLKDAVDWGTASETPGTGHGACQVLASYYYAVILVSRPFLMVELHHRLSEGSPISTSGGYDAASGKSKLADACIEAAIMMVEPVQSLIERGLMIRRAPVVVSWLFASSLVLGAGLLGGFGRILEKYCRASISALEYFGEADAHAMQYSLVAKSLLATALEYLEKREMRERIKRTENSSQIFGLLPRTAQDETAFSPQPHFNSPAVVPGVGGAAKSDAAGPGHADRRSTHFSFDFDASFPGLPDFLPASPELGASFGLDMDPALSSLNLFPLLETDGHIDLANYF